MKKPFVQALDQIPWITLGTWIPAILGVLVLVWVIVGMFQARSLIRREFFAYFTSPIAYVVLVVFLGMTGKLFSDVLDQLTATGPRGVEWPVRSIFTDQRFWVIFAALAPLLTMRLFAEERSSGTLEVLMTSPLRDWQLVLAKYFGCLAFFTVIWLPTLVYLPALLGVHVRTPAVAPNLDPNSIIFLAGVVLVLFGLLLLLPRLSTMGRMVNLFILGIGAVMAVTGGILHFRAPGAHLISITSEVDPFPVVSLYLGMFACGAMFLAIGILISSMVRDQLVSAILALAIGIPFLAAGFLGNVTGPNGLPEWFQYVSVPVHMEQSFGRGVIDSRPLILYASVTLFCLFMTIRSVEARRWS